jgi:hypothetical protein
VVREELRKVVNANCVDVSVGIPDHVLAEHLLDSLIQLRRTFRNANEWRGIPPFKPGQKVTVEAPKHAL